ncbi:MAG: glycosyltransferase family 39 protein [Alphaproteobacteria bacterium]|nr:glycosyltransferase family 39 protein [Alphaproteobacteria bacterium]
MRYLVPSLLALLLALLLGMPSAARADAGPAGMVAEGDRLGPAVVTAVELHAEYERIHLSVGEVVLPPVELLAVRPGRSGMCVHRGRTAFPRWDMAEERPWPTDPEDAWIEGERAPQNPEEEAFAAVCARMESTEARPLQIVVPTGPAAGEAPPADGPRPSEQPSDERTWPETEATAAPAPAPSVRPAWVSFAVAGALGVGGLLALSLGLGGMREPGVKRDALALTVLGLVARVGAGPWSIFNGGGAAWEKLALAMGLRVPPDLYGDGYALLHQAGSLGAGVTVGSALGVQLLLSVLAVPALFAVLRALHGPLVARAGALALAVLPLALWLSSTEVMTGPASTLCLLSAACAVTPGVVAGLAAGLLAGAAVHTRPECLLFLPAIASLPLAVRGRAALREPGPWLALVLGGVLAGIRLWTLPTDGAAPLDLARLSSPAAWLGVLLPRFAGEGPLIHVALDLRWSSPLLALALPLALWRSPDRARLAPWLLWLLPTVVLVTKSWPLADALRLQLLVAPAWCALVGVAAASGSERHARLALLPVAALVALPLLWGGPGFARQDEWRLLRDGLPDVPETRTLRYVGSPRDRLRHEVVAPGHQFVPLAEGPVQDGEILLVDVACHVEPTAAACRRALETCADQRVIAERLAPRRVDLDEQLAEPASSDPLRLALIELSGCRAPETPPVSPPG